MGPPHISRLDASLLTATAPAQLTAKDARGRPIVFDARPPEVAPAWAAALLDSHNKNADALIDIANNGLPVAQSKTEAFRTIRVAMPSDAPFIEATPLHGNNIGAGYYNLGYLMEPGGRFSMRGAVENLANTNSIVQLPTGYFPSGAQAFICDSIDGVSYLRISTGGLVTLLTSTGTNKIAYLECVGFIVPNAAAPHRFQNSGWPLIVNHGFDVPVTALTVVACRAKGSAGLAANGSPYLDWEDRGDGSLKIHAAWGLQWGKVYDVRVHLSTEVDK